MDALWSQGASISAYDPVAMDEARHLYPDHPNLKLTDSAMDAVAGADALIIMTEWNEFKSPSWAALKDALNSPVIFDGRNLYEPSVVADNGITYYCIGRPTAG